MHLTSNVYIFLLSTKTIRKNKCGFKLKWLPLIRNSGLEWQLDYRKLFWTTTTFYFTLFAAGIPGAQGLDKNNMYDSLVLFSFSFVLSLFTIPFYRLKVGRVERVWCGGNGACQYADQKSWGKKQYIQTWANIKLHQAWNFENSPFICLYLFICLQVNTSALSDMIDPSERKVSEFPTVGENCAKTNGVVSWCGYLHGNQKLPW